MKLARDVSQDKLRGGYYTPSFVVDWCINHISKTLGATKQVQILEPSAGDGAFVRGLARSSISKVIDITCIEKSFDESRKCKFALDQSGLAGTVINNSFFNWLPSANRWYDCVLGNPPFIRYQFVPTNDRSSAEKQLLAAGQDLAGVSNLYIPFVLLSLLHLRPGGAFAMVLPSEVLCTSSGDQVRCAMIEWLSELHIDLFPRESFPDILQDVVVFSGIKRDKPAMEVKVSFAEHFSHSIERWSHCISTSDFKWTKFLLNGHVLDVLNVANRLKEMHVLGDIAKFTVSIVTGANSYFAVDSKTIARNNMHAWARPLMSRSYDSPGLIFRKDDHSIAEQQGRPAWLLDFSSDAPKPEEHDGALQYLISGENNGFHSRYKCRIRSPWYRVPHVWAGKLMMSKRANLHHRVLLNEADVLTTDTIYRGSMKSGFEKRERDFVACFHNSLTLLSTELEGRTYGGGVLELVPSEISSLRVPLLESNGHLGDFDKLSRESGGQRDPDEKLVHATNAFLSDALPGFRDLLPVIEEGRVRLRRRRFAS